MGSFPFRYNGKFVHFVKTKSSSLRENMKFAFHRERKNFSSRTWKVAFRENGKFCISLKLKTVSSYLYPTSPPRPPIACQMQIPPQPLPNLFACQTCAEKILCKLYLYFNIQYELQGNLTASHVYRKV